MLLALAAVRKQAVTPGPWSHTWTTVQRGNCEKWTVGHLSTTMRRWTCTRTTCIHLRKLNFCKLDYQCPKPVIWSRKMTPTQQKRLLLLIWLKRSSVNDSRSPGCRIFLSGSAVFLGRRPTFNCKIWHFSFFNFHFQPFRSTGTIPWNLLNYSILL